MDIDTDDDVLRTLSEGNNMDYEQWPALLSRLTSRLEKTVESEFPNPAFLPSQPTSSHPMPSSPPGPPSSTKAESESQSSTQPEPATQTTNKENKPSSRKTPHTNLLPTNEDLLKSIISTLSTLFAKYPPHTIQRLAELILRPRQHYKTLSSYLHAVDRVVHVSSGANTFPLPPAIPDPSSVTVLSNGNADPFAVSWTNAAANAQASLGSDESLGGALLTPIPWLTKSVSVNGGSQHSGGSHSPMEREVKTESTEMIEGPNGPGGIETVSVSVNGVSSTTSIPPTSSITSESSDVSAHLRAEGGVTQGELLRQEQRAGVVPAAQLVGNRGDSEGLGEEDEVPHARGPEEIGLEDTGLRLPSSSTDVVGPSVGVSVSACGIDVEAAVGRKLEPEPEKENEKEREGEDSEMKDEPESPGTSKREAGDQSGGLEKKVKEDGDTEMIVDEEGKGEEGEKGDVDVV